MQKQIKSDLLRLRAYCDEANEDPCEANCPFGNEGTDDFTCTSCAVLFPGWAENWLNEHGLRTWSLYPAPWDSRGIEKWTRPDCPCRALGNDFVSCRIEHFLTKETT